ncbi:MAG TPA: DNA repair protein RadC [Burkholderiales bacterium]|nr:DNA repair protein RadC [Burkholderiales bacterium]
MELHALSDVDLLGVMVGPRRAVQLLKETRGSIAGLLSDSLASYHVEKPANQRLLAAREFIKRSLAEGFRNGDALTSPQAVRDYLRISLMGRSYEVFMVLFLDAQHRLIEAEEMFRGTLTQTSVYPREVVKRSLYFNAAAVLFAHNHPSGVAQPSQSDELLTRSLRDALSLIEVRVLDHFVIGGNVVMSFAERGLL